MARRTRSERIEPQLIATIAERLRANKRVRRTLPGRGRLHIDRQLPFLIVYRRPTKRDDSGVDRLVLGEASYLAASMDRVMSASLRELVRAVTRTLGDVFGGFLIVEVWSAADVTEEDAVAASRVPKLTIFAPRDPALGSTLQALEGALTGSKILRITPRVERTQARNIAPPGASPLLTTAAARDLGAHLIGLELQPIFRDAESGQIYPRVLRSVQRQLSRALKRACFEYTRSQTTHLPTHYQALGRRAMVKAVWEVDERLAEISNAFDFLLYVSPANPEPAWREFKRRRCERVPEFIYRFSPADPALLKRRLYQVPIERIEDPVIADLFSEKQLDLDRKLTMLIDRGTPRFLFGSLQVFGGVSDDLAGQAEQLLQRLPRRSPTESRGGTVDADGFVRRAREELAYFRRLVPDMRNGVEVRSDITGLMVSRGKLLVGQHTSIPAARVEALVQHELGTHLLTYVNGRAQPLKQLYSGLAGYDELQEGLAVLAEHFVDGLSASRMRLLAARVLAVRDLIAGASFIETFRKLNKTHGFDQRTAFMITMRVYRAGGLTKDATYLRGLARLVHYLKRGGEFEPLLIGKIAEKHVPIIRELLWREVLRPPPLRPRYLDDTHFTEKLQRLRAGATLYDLITKEGMR